jgi:hypothetical protein
MGDMPIFTPKSPNESENKASRAVERAKGDLSVVSSHQGQSVSVLVQKWVEIFSKKKGYKFT